MFLTTSPVRKGQGAFDLSSTSKLSFGFAFALRETGSAAKLREASSRIHPPGPDPLVEELSVPHVFTPPVESSVPSLPFPRVSRMILRNPIIRCAKKGPSLTKVTKNTESPMKIIGIDMVRSKEAKSSSLVSRDVTVGEKPLKLQKLRHW